MTKRVGWVGLFDGDCASLTLSHDDPVQGKVYDEANQQAIITNPRVMRRMPRLLRDSGLELAGAFSYVVADIGTANFWVPAIESLRTLVPQAGAMGEGEFNAWADARLNESDEGIVFGASNHYAYVARRP